MKNWKVAAAIAVATASAQPAYAADFIKYTFQTTGTGSVMTMDSRTGQQSYATVRGVAISYILPLVGIYADNYLTTSNGNQIFDAVTANTTLYWSGRTILTAGGSALTVNESGSVPRGAPGSTVVAACGNVGGIFPVQSFDATPNCGEARISYSAGSSYSLNYVGMVNRVDVALGTGTPPQQYGLMGFTTFVPEPSSWMLMIAGFGLVSYAVRRRRHRLILA